MTKWTYAFPAEWRDGAYRRVRYEEPMPRLGRADLIIPLDRETGLAQQVTVSSLLRVIFGQRYKRDVYLLARDHEINPRDTALLVRFQTEREKEFFQHEYMSKGVRRLDVGEMEFIFPPGSPQPADIRLRGDGLEDMDAVALRRLARMLGRELMEERTNTSMARQHARDVESIYRRTS